MKKRSNIYIINIVLVLIIFLFVLFSTNTYPFGKNDLSISDGSFQFLPLIYDYLTKIRLGLLGTFSFNNGLGNPTLLNALYYNSSPINYLLIWVKDPNNMYFLALITKLIITAICMTKYTKSKTESNTTIIIATLSYCFCSWFYSYYYYSTFVDIFMIFPLFQYGLEKVLKRKFSYSYILSLTYMIISNFYLCFAVCIYTIIFFILYNIYIKSTIKDFFKNLLWIIFNTIIALLISFFWLYTLVDSYIRIGLSSEKTYEVTNYYVSYKRFLAFLYYGNYELVFKNYGEKIPNISCPTIILISIFYYFLNRNISNRQKLFALFGLLLSLLAIFGTKFDFVLNMFHQTRGLTYRYSFIICFLAIVLFIQNMNTLDLNNRDTKKGLLISICLVLILNIYCYLLHSKTAILIESIGISSLLVIILLYQKQRIYKILLLLPIILQIIIGTSSPFQNHPNVQNFHPKYKLKDDRYRMVNIYNYCSDYIDNMLGDYNCNLYDNSKTLNVYTSMTYNNVIYDLKKLGVDTFLNTCITSNTRDILVNMLLNVKGKYYLEKIYSVNKDVLKTHLKDNNVVDNQNSLIKNMTGIDNVFRSNKVQAEYRSNKYFYEINSNYYYVDLYNEKGKKNNILAFSSEIFQNKNAYNKEITYYLYDNKQIEKVYDYLSKNQISYTYYTDSKLEGTIQVDKDQMIFTSIPYDTNWEIYLDGKKVKPVKILNSLIGIEAKEGKHTIKLEYKYHLLIPALVSLISFLSLVISAIIKRVKRKNIRKEVDEKC